MSSLSAFRPPGAATAGFHVMDEPEDVMDMFLEKAATVYADSEVSEISSPMAWEEVALGQVATPRERGAVMDTDRADRGVFAWKVTAMETGSQREGSTGSCASPCNERFSALEAAIKIQAAVRAMTARRQLVVLRSRAALMKAVVRLRDRGDEAQPEVLEATMLYGVALFRAWDMFRAEQCFAYCLVRHTTGVSARADTRNALPRHPSTPNLGGGHAWLACAAGAPCATTLGSGVSSCVLTPTAGRPPAGERRARIRPGQPLLRPTGGRAGARVQRAR